MSTQVLVTKDKVQRYLSDLVGGLEIDRDGRFTFRHGSARMFVGVYPHGDDATVIHITAPLLFNVAPSNELFHYIATKGGEKTFGHLSAVPHDRGVNILYVHSLLGDYLDPEELNWAVGAMAGTADAWDTELQQMFGGELYHEDVPRT